MDKELLEQIDKINEVLLTHRSIYTVVMPIFKTPNGKVHSVETHIIDDTVDVITYFKEFVEDFKDHHVFMYSNATMEDKQLTHNGNYSKTFMIGELDINLSYIHLSEDNTNLTLRYCVIPLPQEELDKRNLIDEINDKI